MQKNQEAIEKLKLIRNLLKERSEQALLITEQPSFSWITGGGRGFLGLASTNAFHFHPSDYRYHAHVYFGNDPYLKFVAFEP